MSRVLYKSTKYNHTYPRKRCSQLVMQPVRMQQHAQTVCHSLRRQILYHQSQAEHRSQTVHLGRQLDRRLPICSNRRKCRVRRLYHLYCCAGGTQTQSPQIRLELGVNRLRIVPFSCHLLNKNLGFSRYLQISRSRRQIRSVRMRGVHRKFGSSLQDLDHQRAVGGAQH